jgi:hypothetical protein
MMGRPKSVRRSARSRGDREDAELLTADIIELARQYCRYGYRKIAALPCQAGWSEKFLAN